MDYKKFKVFRALIAFFVAATVAMAVTADNIVLAAAGIIIGLVFLFLVKRKTKTVLVDERTRSIASQAARFAYSVSTVAFAFLSLALIIAGRRMENAEFESTGINLSYITLASLGLYAIAYKYFSKKYGDGDEE